jgi:biotin--protein ligase
MHLTASAPVIFIQYIAAIAIVEGIKFYEPGYEVLPIKLKWPNDVYALDPKSPPGQKQWTKIAGILVNSSYSNGAYNLVVGIGLNTTNPAPTTSLNALCAVPRAPPTKDAFASPKPESYRTLPPFTLEKLLARILTKFEDVRYLSLCI